MIYRHGDLLIRPTKTIPEGAKKLSKGKVNILALGEVTGHSHRLQTAVDIELYELGTEKYFTLPSEATLSHEEHKPIKLRPETYKVITEREYDYFLQETKKVLD